MKIIAQIARILVGIEFIFSGFVKVVDPYGTGLKLQEYFEVFAADAPLFAPILEFFAHQSQTLSLIFCASELILGVALLVGFRMRQTALIALLLMAFFTFLTFYSAYFNKVTDCGCFGDFLKLKPWHSFLKDIISLAVIFIIFLYRKSYKPLAFAAPVVALGTLISFGIGIYALRYLPPIDFLPYAIGKSIPEQMKPTGIKPDIDYFFLDKTKNETITSKEYLMDTVTYSYVDSKILNQDELSPKITDYSLSDSQGNDATATTFEGTKLLITFKKIDHLDPAILSEIKTLEKAFASTAVKPILVTSLVTSVFTPFAQKEGFSSEIHTIDEKVLKTMARTNPCVILLKNGVVQGKWSGNNLPSKQEIEHLQ